MTHAQQAGAPTARAAIRTRPSKDRHSAWTIALHWATVLALVLSITAALWRELIEDKALRIVLMDVHRQLGLFVLVVLLLRLIVRFSAGLADHAGEMPVLMRWAAQLAHVALYGLLFVMTILGLAVSNAHAVQIKLFGLILLPSLVDEDSDLADMLTDYHVWGAWALLALVLAHAGAACWHHWVRHDGVLTAMLPLLKRKQ